MFLTGSIPASRGQLDIASHIFAADEFEARLADQFFGNFKWDKKKEADTTTGRQFLIGDRTGNYDGICK